MSQFVSKAFGAHVVLPLELFGMPVQFGRPVAQFWTKPPGHIRLGGGFSPASTTKKADELVNYSSNVAMKLKLLWLSCGDKDGLIRISRGFHETLEEKKVPHIWHVHADGGLDFAVWKIELYHFVPLLFR